MITFHNPGELDPRLITTFGVSIKESTNPIGYFGTGLKYALAVLIRTGHKVTIHTGETQLDFLAQPETIRGREINRIYMVENEDFFTLTPMPFATDLGRNWEPWMAYRELVCNAMDEGGGACVGVHDFQGDAGYTCIEVSGKPIEEVHKFRHKYFLSGTPVFATADCEVYARSGSDIFYRGVKVGEHTLPGLYTYNMLCQVKLTEDRTVSPEGGDYTIKSAIESAWGHCESEKMLEEVLVAKPKSTLEGNLNFATYDLPYGDQRQTCAFVRVAKRLAGSKAANLNVYARRVAEEVLPKEKIAPTPAKLSVVETAMLARARAFLAAHFDLPLDVAVSMADSLGESVLGLAIDGEIWVSRMAMAQGTKMLAGTIYEEWVHIHHQHQDMTRGMQNFLLDRLMSMAENVQGEPL